jgi:hypothetical protein
MRKRSYLRVGILAAAVVAALACGGPKTVSRDGYRGILVYSKEDRFRVAVRGERVRVSGTVDGSEIVRIVRPDLRKSWQFRPATKRIFESAWGPTDEAVPGYPLQTGFDSAAYADRFGGKIHRIDDGTHGRKQDRFRVPGVRCQGKGSRAQPDTRHLIPDTCLASET